MPKFKCENPDCSKHGIIEHVTRTKYDWNVIMKRLEAKESFCSECGTFRELIKEYEGWNNAWFKAESNRNYNNKTIKKYDYDHSHNVQQAPEKIKT